MAITRSIATIRLPSSSGRSRNSYLKLLRHVAPDAQTGFGFEGCLLRPGALVTHAELRPSPEYPALPVLLEYGRMPARGIRGHLRCDGLYILWRWEAEAYRWRELGRAVSESWEWAIELRPLALRAMAEAAGDHVSRESAPNLAEISRNIAAFLDQQLRDLNPPDRARLLAVLHDQFSTRLIA